MSLAPAAIYSGNVNAGTATASYTFCGDANHDGSADSVDFSIGKADATIDVRGYSGATTATPMAQLARPVACWMSPSAS